jgi:hypothetical protein
MLKTAELYLKGVTQQEIAAAIGVSRKQIEYDLVDIRTWWRERTVFDLDEWKAEQLAKLDALEAQCWKSWEDSRKPTKITTESKTTAGAHPGSTASERTITSAGDVRFLDGIAGVINQRCRILGLNAPTKLSGVFTSDHEFSEGEIESIAILIASMSKRKN